MDNRDREAQKPNICREILLCPPPNHNPLIGLLQADTLRNVHDSLSTLQELAATSSNGELFLTPASSNGLYFLISCIKDALRFEIDHRDGPDQGLKRGRGAQADVD